MSGPLIDLVDQFRLDKGSSRKPASIQDKVHVYYPTLKPEDDAAAFSHLGPFFRKRSSYPPFPRSDAGLTGPMLT
jgi:hypothetical protein